MRTKNSFVILSVFIIFSLVVSMKIVKANTNPNTATADNITDPADDVVIFSDVSQTCETTDLHDELDIASMVRTGQQIVVTFYEYLTIVTGYFHSLAINNGTDTFVVVYFGDLLGAILTWVAAGSWDGGGWGVAMPEEVGTLSTDLKTLTINIPSEAITLTSSMEWVFTYTFTDITTGIAYMDITPNEILGDMCPNYDNGDGEDDGGLLDSIPGYELSISISISILMIGIIYIYTKKKRFR